jgi:frataxin-like iron-binding protein CyaY
MSFRRRNLTFDTFLTFSIQLYISKHPKWSSPLSGPKRFEYDDNDKLWFSTKDGLNLGHALSQEIHHIYPDLDPIELNV